MRHFGWRWLVLSSVLSVALAAEAETRPQYGGTLRVAIHSALTSLDPTDTAQPDSVSRRNVILLIFETLVTTDENGRPRPGLATSWQTYPRNPSGNQRWELRLRRDVVFHDGTVLTPEIAASSLRTANPSWNVLSTSDSIIIERDVSDPELPAELALPRNAIVKRNSDGSVSGTGPFHLTDLQPGKKLSLTAEENYWRGRPYLDGIEVEMGKSFHDQLIAFEPGNFEMVEVAPEQSYRVLTEGRAVGSSAPMELVALLFPHEAQNQEEQLLREALTLSVGRTAIRNVLLQGAGQASGSILPNWISGYGFVFPAEADLPRARRLIEQARKLSTWTLGYDAGDPLLRLLAERIALNARDAGLTLQPTMASSSDVRLVRIPLATANPRISLVNAAAACGLPPPKLTAGSAEDLYSAERAMLATWRLIPLFHLPVSYATVPSLKSWSTRADGGWDLADAWLGSEKR